MFLLLKSAKGVNNMWLKEELAKELFNRLMSVILYGLECPSMYAEMPLSEYLDKYFLYIDARSRRLKASLCVPFYIDVNDLEEELKQLPLLYSDTGTYFNIVLSDIRFTSHSPVYTVITDRSMKGGKMAFSIRLQNISKEDGKVWNTVNVLGENFVVTDDAVGYSFKNCELVNKLFGEDDERE